MVRGSETMYSLILFLENSENLDNMFPFKTPTGDTGKERKQTNDLAKNHFCSFSGWNSLSVALNTGIQP